MVNLRLAILSDIHGNADALDAALCMIKKKGVDFTIVLGDLLTYGCQPRDVLYKLVQFCGKNDCVFIKGNHDQFYFDMCASGIGDHYDMPDFIRESIEWTASQIVSNELIKMFSWCDSYAIGNVYFAHANPYGYGDWQYVDKTGQCIDAAESLRSRGYVLGVFGHLHRKKAISIDRARNVSLLETGKLPTNSDKIFILNPGSVGQPRGEGFSFMFVNIEANKISYDFSDLNFDVNNSIRLINASVMSDQTKNKIISYLRS